jgi:hypothetical protein
MILAERFSLWLARSYIISSKPFVPKRASDLNSGPPSPLVYLFGEILFFSTQLPWMEWPDIVSERN